MKISSNLNKILLKYVCVYTYTYMCVCSKEIQQDVDLTLNCGYLGREECRVME